MGTGSLFARLLNKGEKEPSSSVDRRAKNKSKKMSAKGASDAPGDAPPAQPITLENIFDDEFIETIQGKATEWKDALTKNLEAELLETDNERHKKYIERVGMHAKWEDRKEDTNNFESLNVNSDGDAAGTLTLQDVVALLSDYTQYKKDVKQVQMYDQKRTLAGTKSRMKKSMEELNEATQSLNEILAEASELMKKTGELVQKINGLHEEIESQDKELNEAKELRKDEDRRFVKVLKEYIAKMQLRSPPPPPPASPEGPPPEKEEDAPEGRSTMTIPPEDAPDVDSDATHQSEQKVPEKPARRAEPSRRAESRRPARAGRKKATVEDD